MKCVAFLIAACAVAVAAHSCSEYGGICANLDNHLLDLKVDAATGYLFAVDNNRKVMVISPNCTDIKVIMDGLYDPIAQPNAIAIADGHSNTDDNTRTLYISNQAPPVFLWRVEFDFDTLEIVDMEEVYPRASYINDLEMAPNGDVLMVDRMHLVIRYDVVTGESHTIVPANSGIVDIFGLATSKNCPWLYITANDNDHLYRCNNIEPNAECTIYSNPTEMSNPWGVDMDCTCQVYGANQADGDLWRYDGVDYDNIAPSAPSLQCAHDAVEIEAPVHLNGYGAVVAESWREGHAVYAFNSGGSFWAMTKCQDGKSDSWVVNGETWHVPQSSSWEWHEYGMPTGVIPGQPAVVVLGAREAHCEVAQVYMGRQGDRLLSGLMSRECENGYVCADEMCVVSPLNLRTSVVNGTPVNALASDCFYSHAGCEGSEATIVFDTHHVRESTGLWFLTRCPDGSSDSWFVNGERWNVPHSDNFEWNYAGEISSNRVTLNPREANCEIRAAFAGQEPAYDYSCGCCVKTTSVYYTKFGDIYKLDIDGSEGRCGGTTTSEYLCNDGLGHMNEVAVYTTCAPVPSTPTPTPTPPSVSRSPSPSPIASVSPTPTRSRSPTRSRTPTRSRSPSPSRTPTRSRTPSPSVTPTPSRSPSRSVTPTSSVTPTRSRSPSPSRTPTRSRTSSPSVTPTPSRSPSPSVTPTPSRSPTPSVTSTPSVTPTPSRSPSPSVTTTPTRSPSPSVTPTPSRSPSPSVTPTPSTSSSPSVSSTPSVTPSPSTSPSVTVTPSTSVSPTPTPTPTPIQNMQIFVTNTRSETEIGVGRTYNPNKPDPLFITLDVRQPGQTVRNYMDTIEGWDNEEDVFLYYHKDINCGVQPGEEPCSCAQNCSQTGYLPCCANAHIPTIEFTSEVVFANPQIPLFLFTKTYQVNCNNASVPKFYVGLWPGHGVHYKPTIGGVVDTVREITFTFNPWSTTGIVINELVRVPFLPDGVVTAYEQFDYCQTPPAAIEEYRDFDRFVANAPMCVNTCGFQSWAGCYCDDNCGLQENRDCCDDAPRYCSGTSSGVECADGILDCNNTCINRYYRRYVGDGVCDNDLRIRGMNWNCASDQFSNFDGGDCNEVACPGGICPPQQLCPNPWDFSLLSLNLTATGDISYSESAPVSMFDCNDTCIPISALLDFHCDDGTTDADGLNPFNLNCELTDGIIPQDIINGLAAVDDLQILNFDPEFLNFDRQVCLGAELPVECVATPQVRVGDGACDPDSTFNNEDCLWDGGDCCYNTCNPTFYPCDIFQMDCQDPNGCPAHTIEDKQKLGDQNCDAHLNIPECLYDGGDCCLPSASPGDCINPLFANL